MDTSMFYLAQTDFHSQRQQINMKHRHNSVRTAPAR